MSRSGSAPYSWALAVDLELLAGAFYRFGLNGFTGFRLELEGEEGLLFRTSLGV